jgi:N-acetylmuramoyl-L-alanine amidase
MRCATPASRRRHGPTVLAAGCVAVAVSIHPFVTAGAQQPVSPSPPPAPPVFTIVVDPGHGGDDHGAVGSTGVEEKALVLGVAQRLQSLAASHGGLRVRLTREDDHGLTLDERATLANGGPGGVFISLHANFSPSPRTAGVEVGTFLAALAPVVASPVVARRGGPPPATPAVPRASTLVRWDQAQAQHVERASTVAQRLVERFRTAGATAIGPRAWYQAPLKPLAAVNMPAVLIELGYLSNTEDEAALVAEKRQDALAQAILDVVSSMIDGGPALAGAR